MLIVMESYGADDVGDVGNAEKCRSTVDAEGAENGGHESAATPAGSPNGWCSTRANPARKPNGMYSTSANLAHSPSGMSVSYTHLTLPTKA